MCVIRRFSAELSNLLHLRAFLRETAESMGVDAETTADLMLALDEVATNVIVHGYRSDTAGHLEVELAAQGPDLFIRVRDDAPSYDPTRAPVPDLSLPLEQRPLGGLGVYLVKSVVDEMHYRPLETGGNELTLVKKGILT